MRSHETRELQSESSPVSKPQEVAGEGENVLVILKDIMKDLKLNRENANCQKRSQMQWYCDVLSKQAPRLRRSLTLKSAALINWTNNGGPWRAYLVLTGGVITSITISGVFVFLLFFVSPTIFVSATVTVAMLALLVSVATAGAVIAVFFMALTGIYITAIVVSTCVISGIFFITIVTAVFVSGSITFWWMVWLGTVKFLQGAQNSLTFRVSPSRNVSGAV